MKVLKSLIHLIAGYARSNLALWAYGIAGAFGFAKEAVWGTAVAATDYAELMSENLVTGIDRFETRNIVGGYYEPTDYAGIRRNGGGTILAGHPVSIGHLLRAAFNNASATTVLSGFLYTMNYTSTKSEFADGVPRQPYTLEMYRDVTSSHQYAGAILNRLTMSLAPNQDLRLTADWLAKSRLLIARTTPTFPASSQYPFTFDAASISIAGAATARIEALTIAIDNQLDGIAALNNSNEIARVRVTGPQMIRISGTLDFTDVAEEQDFINQTERSIAVNIFRGQSFNILMNAPLFVYTAFPLGMSGRGRQTIQFDGRARYVPASLSAIGFQLTTIKSNY